MRAAALLFLWTLAITASAARVSVPLSYGLDLTEAIAVPWDAADVRMVTIALEAPHGIRPEGSARFRPHADPVLGGAYHVFSSQGALYRVVLAGLTATRATYEVAPLPASDAKAQPVADSGAVAGRYGGVEVKLDDRPSDARYPSLRIAEDGQFHLGSASGTWRMRHGYLFLAGYYAGWGPGAIKDGRVVFRFERGGVHFEVAFVRDGDAVSVAASGR